MFSIGSGVGIGSDFTLIKSSSFLSMMRVL